MERQQRGREIAVDLLLPRRRWRIDPRRRHTPGLAPGLTGLQDCVCVRVCVYKKEREREREREIHTETQRDGEQKTDRTEREREVCIRDRVCAPPHHHLPTPLSINPFTIHRTQTTHIKQQDLETCSDHANTLSPP